ncbi:MAG: pirin family protein [Deltaproteobacteria bacterium]|nr:pirin family protein [Deltaproteobacteria bacterium]
MTAGRGITHSERPPADRIGQMKTVHGLRVWVGLPQAAGESEPSFQHAPKASLPPVDEAGLSLRVVLGSWQGAASPIRLASPTLYAVAELGPDASLPLLNEAQERAVYVVEGSLGSTAAPCTAVSWPCPPHQEGALTAITRARVAVFGGEPLDGPRYMLWNFVSSRKDRLGKPKTTGFTDGFRRSPATTKSGCPSLGRAREGLIAGGLVTATTLVTLTALNLRGLIIRTTAPEGSFDAATPPEPPDYADPKHWSALPSVRRTPGTPRPSACPA